MPKKMFFIAAFSAGIALLIAGLHWFERVNLYIPSKVIDAIPRSYGIPFDDVWLTTRDGVKINGWFIKGNPGMPAVLFFHGNGGNLSHRLEKIRILHAIGASVFIIDYRGYGNSEGTPSERGTYIDAEAAYDYLTKERKVSENKIIFHGESLGCGVAVELATRHHPMGLIVESGFTSTVDMGKVIFPHLPVQWLIRYRYDNLSKISRVGCPVLVLHSPQDDIVPFKMGRRLFEAAAPPKRFVELKGDHNEGFMTSEAIYKEALKRFIEAPRSI